MPIHVPDKQLNEMENGRKAAVIVRSRRTKKTYAVIKESVYDQLRPLLQLMASDLESPDRTPRSSPPVEWTPEKNARRVALINKKHDQGLGPAEKKELRRLMAEADAHRDEAAPVRNKFLELILAGLRKQPPRPSSR